MLQITDNEILTRLDTLPLNTHYTIKCPRSIDIKYHDANLLQTIYERTKFLDVLTRHISMSERIHCIKHHITEIQKCKICQNVPVRWVSTQFGYKVYCSNICCGKDPDVRQKISTYAKSAYYNFSEEKRMMIRKKCAESTLKSIGVISPVCLSSTIKKSKISTAKRIYATMLQDTRCQPNFTEEEFIELKLKRYSAHDTSDINLSWICSTCGKIFEAKLHREYHSGCPYCANNYIGRSRSEEKIVNLIKTLYSGKLILNSKNIISPYELDIYIPDLSLAFEFNGLYWHMINRNLTTLKNNRFYHLNKTYLCEQQNIRLVHIWEDLFYQPTFNDWIKSIICNTEILDIDTTQSIIELDHSYYPIWTKIPGYQFMHETEPLEMIRTMKNKYEQEYHIYDCGKLIFKKL